MAWKTCLSCEGRGYVANPERGSGLPRTVECRDCDGRGTVVAVRRRKNIYRVVGRVMFEVRADNPEDAILYAQAKAFQLESPTVAIIVDSDVQNVQLGTIK